ncbi:MAG TPA: TfoX/Sxy family protein [Bauldia sp.]|nr:TfoX/Sxy family protein [Bauldia sp.]
MADVDHLAELFAPLGGVTFKRMFSGYGIMKDGMMFALISRDELYLKVDDDFATRFRAEGSRQWRPRMRGKTMAMPYWQLPERLFDEPDEFAEWARTAFEVTRRLKAAKKPKKSARAAKSSAPAGAGKVGARPRRRTAARSG